MERNKAVWISISHASLPLAMILEDKIGEKWIGIWSSHVGASLLLAGSCGFYIGFAWQLACGTDGNGLWMGQSHMHEQSNTLELETRRQQRIAPV